MPDMQNSLNKIHDFKDHYNPLKPILQNLTNIAMTPERRTIEEEEEKKKKDEDNASFSCINYVVGKAIRYGMNGPRIVSPWGVRLSTPVQTSPGAQPAYCTMGTGSFPRVKRLGCSGDHPPPYSAEVKERVQL
jgi:hypothetical protein